MNYGKKSNALVHVSLLNAPHGATDLYISPWYVHYVKIN